MPRKLSRNAPCPCGSGKKYKHCCIRKDFDWMEMDDGSLTQRIPIPDEMAAMLEGMRNRYVERHGCEPERVFEDAPPLEHMEHWIVQAMTRAGVEPALIYAFEKTDGLLLNKHNENKVPDIDIAQWEAAIDEYEAKTGRKASRRRLTDQDFAATMQQDPEQRTKTGAVERLPFPPPFDKESWGNKQLSDLVKDPECFDYFQRCLAEVTRSGRGEAYLDTFLMIAHGGEPPENEREYKKMVRAARKRQLTVEELDNALTALAESCTPDGAFSSAVAAFEFLGFIGDVVSSYAEHLNAEERLEESLTMVRGLALMAFAAAVNAELGIRNDIWRPTK